MINIKNKQIRPTRVEFSSSNEREKFEEYISSTEKTKSIGMEQMREKMRQFKKMKKE